MLAKLQKIGLIIAGALGVFGVVGTGYIMVRDTNKTPPRPDLAADEFLAEQAVEGPFSIAVVRNKNRIYDRHWPEGEITSETRYPVGSMAEIFSAMAVMHAHDQGLLDFDQSLGQILPNLPSTFHRITLAHLLAHTSGLGGDAFDPAVPPVYEPGEKAEYSPANMQVIESVMEKVSGQPMHQYIAENVIAPLDMPNTVYDMEKGWLSTIEDLLVYEKDLNPNRLVKLKTLLRGFSPFKLNDGAYGLYGFGWTSENARGLRMERNGAPASEGVIARFPEKTFAVVVLAEQGAGQDLREIAAKVAEIYLNREMPHLPVARAAD
jgi:CubicO group peptidase (beta-lactamase class C family)